MSLAINSKIYIITLGYIYIHIYLYIYIYIYIYIYVYVYNNIVIYIPLGFINYLEIILSYRVHKYYRMCYYRIHRYITKIYKYLLKECAFNIFQTTCLIKFYFLYIHFS